VSAFDDVFAKPDSASAAGARETHARACGRSCRLAHVQFALGGGSCSRVVVSWRCTVVRGEAVAPVHEQLGAAEAKLCQCARSWMAC
jgi:hypothetical protein